MERINVSPEEFIKKAVTSKNGISLMEVEGLIETSTSDKTKLHGVIHDVIFKGPCRFHNLDLSEGVVFVSCVFEDVVSIRNATQTKSPNPTFAFGIAFSRCTFNQTIFIQDSTLIDGLSIFGSTVKQSLEIGHLTSKEGYLTIENCDLARVQIRGVQTEAGVRLSNNRLSHQCQIYDINSHAGLQVIRNEMAEHVLLQRGSIAWITFDDNIFQKHVSIDGINNSGTLTFIRDTFQGNVAVNMLNEANEPFGQHKSIKISDSKFHAGLFINGNVSKIESIEVTCSPELKGTIRIAGCNIENAILRYDNHYANIIYKDCLFRTFLTESFSNYGNVTLSSCAAIPDTASEILIEDSNLGKMQFLNLDLYSFRQVTIGDSILSNIQFSGVRWFNDASLHVNGDALRAARYREVYRQLRMACENQYERVQVLEFRARELKWLKEEISQRQRFWDGDRMILWLSQTNDHGQNWGKAIRLLVLGTLASYILMVMAASEKLASLPAQSIADALSTLQVLANEFHVFFELFNPTRTLRFVFEDGIRCPTLVYGLDALHRIFLAFFVVQIVSAFRKFFKS